MELFAPKRLDRRISVTELLNENMPKHACGLPDRIFYLQNRAIDRIPHPQRTKICLQVTKRSQTLDNDAQYNLKMFL